MYEYIKGALIELTPSHAIIENHGLAYRILIAINAYKTLCSASGDAHLHLSFVVREDVQQLFGFTEKEERNFFEILCTISGIGPKTALQVVGNMPLSDLKFAIASGDTKTISRTPGIGKKTAERLIIEMKDRIHQKSSTHLAGDSALLSDALTALTNLGYGESHASKALQKALQGTKPPSLLPDLITEALKLI